MQPVIRQMRGTIVKALAGFYYVKPDGFVDSAEPANCEDPAQWIYACKARGIFKNEGIKPYVGDDVEFEVTHQEDREAVITDIKERRNSFIRPPIANVQQFAVIAAAAKPKPNTDIIDKFLVNAEKYDTEIIICINKTDLDKNASVQKLKEIYEDIYPMYFVSGKTGEGMEELKKALEGKRTAFAGASGVGKSTILNYLHPKADAATGSISQKTSRGRHTTRHVELFSLEPSGEVFDTPGFTSFETVDAEEDELQELFPEIGKLAGECRFDDCRHIAEPDCAVRKAVDVGRISSSRYDSYLNQLKEIRQRNSY